MELKGKIGILLLMGGFLLVHSISASENPILFPGELEHMETVGEDGSEKLESTTGNSLENGSEKLESTAGNSPEEAFESFDEGNGSDDEFGEFEEFDQGNDSASVLTSGGEHQCSGSGDCGSRRSKNLIWVIGILLTTALTGFFVRSKLLRTYRGVFLLAALVILGFYKGGCPCPVMSFQNIFLLGLGSEVHWNSLIWFLGLIPVTYLFGRVWCGWICHLGALQELIHLPGKIKLFQSRNAQRNMRIIRIVLLITLIVQLMITKTNLFVHIDPFKVAFNLFSVNLTGWILLGLLLVSAVFIYRPFCKTACPIGLVLGWVSKIPGASVIGHKGGCSGCKSCHNACNINAITREDKFSVLDNQECIGCGECLGNCNKGVLSFFRKSKHHEQKVICERN